MGHIYIIHQKHKLVPLIAQQDIMLVRIYVYHVILYVKPAQVQVKLIV